MCLNVMIFFILSLNTTHYILIQLFILTYWFLLIRKLLMIIRHSLSGSTCLSNRLESVSLLYFFSSLKILNLHRKLYKLLYIVGIQFLFNNLLSSLISGSSQEILFFMCRLLNFY